MSTESTAAQPEQDSRFCYGANCTWFGPITDVGSTGKYKVKDKAEHFPPFPGSADAVDISLPCCPCCGGMLFELPQESEFWLALQMFEAGTYQTQAEQPAARPHPGYEAMWKWQQEQKTCFATAQELAAAFKTATGTAVDVGP